MKATINGKKVKEAHFHLIGELLWIEFVTEEGEKIQTYYFHGTT